MFLELFVFEDFLFFFFVELLEFHVFIHVVSDLFFGVKPEIIDKLFFDFEVGFALTPVPDFNEIAMIFFVPSEVFAQRIDFLFNH